MILLILLFIAAFLLGIMYLAQFHIYLDGKKEYLLKDGLIRELLDKAVNDPDPEALYIDQEDRRIQMGRVEIASRYVDIFWFPYRVEKQPKNFRERMTEDDWGGTVGYITRFSKDYYRVKALLKKDKVNIEKTQRQKLNLEK